MAEYFYLDADGQSVRGPFGLQDVWLLRERGLIAPHTMVCPAGREDWLPLAAYSELMPDLSVLPGKHGLASRAWRLLLGLAGVLLVLVAGLAFGLTRRPFNTASPRPQVVSLPMPTPTPAPVSVADLERTYRAAAAALTDQLRVALAQEATQARLLGSARAEEVEEKKLEAIEARKSGPFFRAEARRNVARCQVSRDDRPAAAPDGGCERSLSSV